MISILLTEMPRMSLAQFGPVRLLARHHGRYTRPIVAHAIDFRLEDNPAVPREAMLQTATWIARHPLDDLYIVYDQRLVTTRATAQQLRDDYLPHWNRRQPGAITKQCSGGAERSFACPTQVFELPTTGGAAWWEWVEALDSDYNLIKAPKRPRAGELTPEQVDEAPEGQQRLAERLERVFRTA